VDPKSYTVKQYDDAAKTYVSTLTIDASLWSSSFRQVHDKTGRGSGTTSNTISYISYSLNGSEVLVSYKQIEYYTISAPYVGGRSFTESHDLTKRISVAELMNYLPY
jgi:hypothetical protein